MRSASVVELALYFVAQTATTPNVLDRHADNAIVEEWLKQANFSITRIYDRRDNRPECSLTYEIIRSYSELRSN